MSDEGEKTCPLCAEEMDLTDQQLKPCKCGYEICVWCWHHILGMAEKDETEGRCPACRAPYDKEKIVGMADSARLAAEINVERKKGQKAKSKSSEGRKQLSSVRVIQRNLVYIVGLPLNLADEDLLQHREYFGQYGKVLKVSMSRTAAGVIQQFPNNTCSVYITYSKEEEAIRCIQNVHGFLLDGRSLRACFGTTKYCHAWLRNVPCSNPDCLYLHEIGPQEDSFSKDEIISAYTRSRVQQITGAANNMQRRSGNMLPPPADDYCNNSSASAGKPIVKNTSSTASVVRDSPPNGSSGRSISLPAAASWGMRASNGQPQAASIACPNGPLKQKPDTVVSTLEFSSGVAGTTRASSLHGDAGKRPTLNEEIQTMNPQSKPESLKSLKQHISMDSRANPSEKSATLDGTRASLILSCELSCSPASKENDRGISMPAEITNSAYHTGQSCGSVPEKSRVDSDGQIQNLCSDMSSISIDRIAKDEHSGVVSPNSSLSDHGLIKAPGNQGLQKHYAAQYREHSITTVGKTNSINGVYASREQCDWRSDSHAQTTKDTSSGVEDDIISFDSQRLKDPEVISRSSYLTNSSNLLHVSRSNSLQYSDSYGALSLNADHPIHMDNRVSDGSLLHSSGVSVMSNGFPENLVSSASGSGRTLEDSFLLPNEEKGKQMGRFLGDTANGDSNAAVDKGESSIISNILSLDFDSWDESLASPQNLAKLFGENDEQSGSSGKISSSWKVQNNNQSRFSFARQEESKSPAYDVHPSLNAIEKFQKSHSFGQDFTERDLYMDKLGIGNGFSFRNFEESENLVNSHPIISSNKLSGVSRAQISAPPGFSVPSRVPPPGFSSNERVDQAFDPMSGSHLLDTSSLLRNSYQALPTGNVGNAGEIEFMDPAILAVGKGRLQGGLNNPGLDVRSNFPPQLSPFENDARLQLLMQRSLSPQQNMRFADIGDNFSHRSDSYGLSSRLVDQSQVSNLSPFAAQLSLQQSRNALMSNGHWDSWNEVQGGNSLGMAELLRNDRLGYNKFYTGYEDSKYRMPSSGDLYNRTFGM
ncbi:uncharacterized protein LOC133877121 isoform X2 [Alnus glutinosa]|uniref:uncharacterized protein LOC133877121 isoform X2 n=1 Tax=Alnus glutinosa TaxID=3517 RepID=UPI002D78C007|nr:uncharacterized protein LOC133877121 isoform X2 [Alnus glutinosa]